VWTARCVLRLRLRSMRFLMGGSGYGVRELARHWHKQASCDQKRYISHSGIHKMSCMGTAPAPAPRNPNVWCCWDARAIGPKRGTSASCLRVRLG
jgi:hypothetical protein